MNHGMAIRTNGSQIAYWVDFVLFSYLRQLLQVVYVNEPFGSFAICDPKVESARHATVPVVVNTFPARFSISLVSID